MDVYIDPEGCDLFCEFCAPDNAKSWPDGGGEADCPSHCSECHQPLENNLTGDGVEYVLSAMRESLKAGRAARNTVHACNGTHYEGSRHCEITRDWAEQISWYNLPHREARFVSRYLDWTSA